MFPLIETIIGFAVIMLMLSLLVKSMTSVIKNHIEYYSQNLENEVRRLIDGTIRGGIAALDESKKRLLQNIQWERLGDEYLTKKNIQWLLKKLGFEVDTLTDLEARLEVHKANIRFAFEKRTKSISLVLGLAFCLAMNINAFTIWDTLYNDQQIRSKFASVESVESALETAKNELEDIKTAEQKLKESAPTDVDAEKQREALKKQREGIRDRIFHLSREVNFGMGKIWTEPVKGFGDFLFQFFGSLLTGILVSIGAPYWHDLLRTISTWRKR